MSAVRVLVYVGWGVFGVGLGEGGGTWGGGCGCGERGLVFLKALGVQRVYVCAAAASSDGPHHHHVSHTQTHTTTMPEPPTPTITPPPHQNTVPTIKNSVRALLEKAASTLGYLKMVTPRRRSAAASAAVPDETSSSSSIEEEEAGADGRVRLVYKNGEGRIDGDAEARERARYSNWDGGNLDPDSVARHRHQLGRMGFRDNAHAKGIF